MAQQRLNSEEILSVLKIDDNGWNAKLFQDKNAVNNVLCRNCNGVCRDAVELGCDHDDDDIFLFCDKCLKELIKDNDNKCIINNHSNPEISANRSQRRSVRKMTVCVHIQLIIKYNATKMMIMTMDIL